jgi:hypothetical protein
MRDDQGDAADAVPERKMRGPDAAVRADSPFTQLRGERILETVEKLSARIDERFPGSGLGGVCRHLRTVAAAAARDVPQLGRPIWPLRVFIVAAIAVLVAAAAWMASLLFRVSLNPGNVSEALQGSDAARNDVIFLSLAIFFLVSLETRVKRRRVLRSLHRLRSIVHIVDMHQLTKDPEHVLSPRTETASSPARVLTRFELARYLDYCSEMLSLSSKLAALHVQYVNDAVVLNAVNDIETLAASLSNKIWQKIMILDAALPRGP